MVSDLHEDQGEGTLAFGEICEVHEGALGKFADGDVAQPDVEALVLRVQETGKGGVDQRTVETNS